MIPIQLCSGKRGKSYLNLDLSERSETRIQIRVRLAPCHCTIGWETSVERDRWPSNFFELDIAFRCVSYFIPETGPIPLNLRVEKVELGQSMFREILFSVEAFRCCNRKSDRIESSSCILFVIWSFKYFFITTNINEE